MPEDTMDVVISPDEEAEEWDDLFPFTDDDDMSPDDPGTRRIDPVAPDKFLYIGQALTADEFTRYVESYNFGSNPPNFVVLHHTAIPYTRAAPAPGYALSGAWDAREEGLSEAQIKQRRLRKVHNMKEYYRTRLSWDRGPHLFVDDRYIYLFTPMYETGIHARQGNQYKDSNGKLNYSIGIEVVGHYTNVKWPDPVARLVGHTIAVLKKRLNTFQLVYKPWAGGISGHRDYNKPACPGNAVTNDFIIQVAKQGLQRLNANVNQRGQVARIKTSRVTRPKETINVTTSRQTVNATTSREMVNVPNWIRVVEANVSPGTTYWRLLKVEYWDQKRAGGTHHIYTMSPYDSRQRLVVSNGQQSWRVPLDKPNNEPSANYAMWGGNRYSAHMDGLPSDRIEGMHMPGNQHVSYLLWWEKATKKGQAGKARTTSQTTSFNAELLKQGRSAKKLPLTASAALVKAIAADRFVPISEEVRFKHNGQTYIAQNGQSGRELRVYYVRRGDWGNVRWIKA